MPPLSVLLVEDEPATRSHIAASVRSQEGLRLAAEAATLAEALLELVAKGLSYEEIGGALRLRYNTIASYTKGIYRKLAVRSRGEAVFEARQMGLLD